ncbi:hypothetical protein [Pseudoroseomonas ludipueritiae]|uniref:Uncharacterized protein n=1 Tax=Pseudoroseomonas ludipueritiae TaxID=198093 RepID=A0ABR7RF06_9PROT|nr:hypothetical protein [Pseudoroseomonas ludipueritiae]MBC9180454.1 hypothetical protein [Pseudoroseomonas ludipueritiae]MCG7363227.1 hypothetical protein [Roseomonas sp. ACRSG]
MFWFLLLLVLLVFGLPMMMLFAALSVGIWLVGAVLGLVWAVLTFVFNDAATALLVVAALWFGYAWGRKRQRGL